MAIKLNRFGTAILFGATLGAAGLAGCAASKPVNCDVVRLQREAGRSMDEIAASFAASSAEIAKCGDGASAAPVAAPAPAPAPASDAGGGTASPY